MHAINSSWAPSDEENNGIITKIYELINAKLHYLKAETNCPDEFIHQFVGAIQKEWDPTSCQSIARTSRKDFQNKNL